MATDLQWATFSVAALAAVAGLANAAIGMLRYRREGRGADVALEWNDRGVVVAFSNRQSIPRTVYAVGYGFPRRLPHGFARVMRGYPLDSSDHAVDLPQVIEPGQRLAWSIPVSDVQALSESWSRGSRRSGRFYVTAGDQQYYVRPTAPVRRLLRSSSVRSPYTFEVEDGRC